jgi:hypothetical protein
MNMHTFPQWAKKADDQTVQAEVQAQASTPARVQAEVRARSRVQAEVRARVQARAEVQARVRARAEVQARVRSSGGDPARVRSRVTTVNVYRCICVEGGKLTSVQYVGRDVAFSPLSAPSLPHGTVCQKRPNQKVRRLISLNGLL